MFQTLFDRIFAPRLIADRCFIFSFNIFGELDKALGCIVSPVQQHILDALSQFGLNFFVNCELPCVHNSHVQASANGVKKESRVHRFAYGVISAKRKGNIAHSAADARAREILLDPARRFNEIHRVVAMLFQAGGNR